MIFSAPPALQIKRWELVGTESSPLTTSVKADHSSDLSPLRTQVSNIPLEYQIDDSIVTALAGSETRRRFDGEYSVAQCKKTIL
jgi:hypothetical protein